MMLKIRGVGCSEVAYLYRYVLSISEVIKVSAKDCQAFKHIFTSPSSVEREPKATRSGNARIHGMKRVTRASLSYVATQVILLTEPIVKHCRPYG